MGSGGVAIAALPTVIYLEVPFSDGLWGGGNIHSNRANIQQHVKTISFITIFLNHSSCKII